jgi:hypothetical protein
MFSFFNLSHGDAPVNKLQTPTEKEDYVPPSAARKNTLAADGTAYNPNHSKKVRK